MNIEEFKKLFPMGDNFNVTGGPTPNKKRIEAVQHHLKFTFPRDYLDFLNYFGSLSIEACEKVWPRPKELQSVPYWQYQYGIEVMGLAKNIPDHLNVEKIYLHFRKQTNQEFKILPVIKQIMITKYYYCIDGNGTVYYWSFEEPWIIKRVTDNFFKRLYRLIKELCENTEYLLHNSHKP